MLLIHIRFDPNKAECHSLDEVFFNVYSETTADINCVQAWFFFSFPVGVATETWPFATLVVQFSSQYL